MKTIVRIIGSAVCAVVAYSIPILLTCSFLLKWEGYYTFLLMLASATELVFLFFLIFYKVEEEE